MPELSTKPLKYKSILGFLSEKQLFEHHDVLYAGYVKKVNEIRQKLVSVDKSTANASYSDLRELKVEETFSLNGVKLHEAYFDNMSASGSLPSAKIADWLKKDFGSVESWESDAKACGLSARGWVVVVFDLESGTLHNIVCDVHNQGGIWNAVALLVLDVYEHAYFIDYATGRKAYLEHFTKHVDWNEVNERIERFGLGKFRKS